MNRARKLTYTVWHAMHGRCTKPHYESFKHYGARGIKVCERWDSFDAFVEDMGFQPAGMCIDRINNDGNYEPGNCRWVSKADNNRNRRVNRIYTARGKTQCLTDWAHEIGFSPQVLWARLQKGWDFEEAISVPILRRASTQRLRVAA